MQQPKPQHAIPRGALARGGRGRERPTGPTPLQPLPEEPSRWKCQLDWQAAAVQGGSGRDLSFPLRAWRHVNPGGWLLTSPQSSVPSPRAPVLGQCLNGGQLLVPLCHPGLVG
ncbi:unnamed protein product [Rangifer tarandus platyrhynchus]|uniref:Uncharacterized protein n=1 Tax=Rangifer tarandus platyrhynchus TaxID=3082113 RepID=A0ABN8XZ99_RANTA|nr:unnamed protein product [Rangifer tarandus platyrhynchus]